MLKQIMFLLGAAIIFLDQEQFIDFLKSSMGRQQSCISLLYIFCIYFHNDMKEGKGKCFMWAHSMFAYSPICNYITFAKDSLSAESGRTNLLFWVIQRDFRNVTISLQNKTWVEPQCAITHVYPHTVYKHSTQWLLPHLVQRCRQASLQSREAWVRWVGSPPLRTSYCSLCGFPRVGASECHTERSEENPYLTNDLTLKKTLKNNKPFKTIWNLEGYSKTQNILMEFRKVKLEKSNNL